MALSSGDRVAIADVLSMHGHICDSGELDRLDEVFTADATYDLTDFGQHPLEGVRAIAAAGRALGELNPVGHHITNIVLTELGDGSVHARAKGIGVNADGTCASVTYEDRLLRGEEGWRIERRKVTAHRVPLGGKH
ncbi:nuclear transport factor 2 family protein [Allokutzneria albata]|uniref:SnoaL-like domain-containing protein n=1 Tax=Allokutzneria albata TaxID=211114 RepID=A0A1G9T8V8_ALLAB|nr:nuclear transport factor 2 family protein [Allokutzneria albata]SDM44050.1 SnoaL-like domain-containing protein [Allokutzneria albata]